MDTKDLWVCFWLGCSGFTFICWGIGGLAYAWDKWKSSQYWDDDDSGGDPDKPVTPYDIDPQKDPGDWWKHDITPTKVRNN